MKRVLSLVLAAVVSLTFCVCAQARFVGDVNKDGKVTSSDALLLLQYSIGQINTIDTKIADINGDGNVNSADALIVLRICVGSYDGKLEVDDELVTSYKKDVVDPIISTGKFTMKMVVDNDGKDIPMTLEVRGHDVAATMIDNKVYLVFPQFKVYSEATGYNYNFDFASGSKQSEYTSSEYVTVDGVKYVCEHYINSDSSKSDYYFLDGKLAMIINTNKDGKASKSKIEDLYAGVNDSSFSLSGYIKVDLSKINNT
jgi:hypothetical protein